MKKALVVLSVLALLATVSTSAFAERWGKPGANLAKGQSSIGLEYNYIESTVDLDAHDVVVPFEGINGEHQLQRNQLLVRVGYGLTDQLEAFIKMGGTSTTIEDAFLGDQFALSHDIVGDMEFTIVGGLNATLFQSGDFRLGANGQISYFTINDTDLDQFLFGQLQQTLVTINQSLQGEVFTFEGSLLASYTLGKFTPYGGICMFFSSSNNSYQAFLPTGTPLVSLDVNAKQEEWFGAVCGVNCQVLDNVRVGVELTGVAEGVGVSTGVTIAL